MYHLKKEHGTLRAYKKSKSDFVETSIKEIIELLEDWKYTLEIKKQRKVRSPNQNKFYWGAFLQALSDYTGEEDIEALHISLRDKFIGKAKKNKIKNPKDKRKYIVLKHEQTTTKLDTKEFEEYLENIIWKQKTQ